MTRGIRAPLTLPGFLDPRREVRSASSRDQARVVALAACLLLGGGCELPGRADLRAVWRELSGSGFEARLPPPGLDRPTPNLASVPPRPEPPDRAAREALTRGLEAARAEAAMPRPPAGPGAAAFGPAAAGTPPIPPAPPPPPRLARAAPIPWEAAPPASAAPAPGVPPQAPAPELLAPEPAEAAPPPPPPALLAPR